MEMAPQHHVYQEVQPPRILAVVVVVEAIAIKLGHHLEVADLLELY